MKQFENNFFFQNFEKLYVIKDGMGAGQKSGHPMKETKDEVKLSHICKNIQTFKQLVIAYCSLLYKH